MEIVSITKLKYMIMIKLFQIMHTHLRQKFGGFSNVWGGTVFEPKKREIETYKTLGIDIERYYQKIISDAFILSSDSSLPLILYDFKGEKFIK